MGVGLLAWQVDPTEEMPRTRHVCRANTGPSWCGPGTSSKAVGMAFATIGHSARGGLTCLLTTEQWCWAQSFQAWFWKESADGENCLEGLDLWAHWGNLGFCKRGLWP